MIGVGAEGNLSPLPGAKPFGKYYLLDRIGAGGMAEVFLAVALGPEGFQRTMVIKRMLPHVSQDRAFVRMFVDEAKRVVCCRTRTSSRFRVRKDRGKLLHRDGARAGETLSAVRAKLAERGAHRAGRCVPGARAQVSLGLYHAPSLKSVTGQPLGIIHRDISPSNLMSLITAA